MKYAVAIEYSQDKVKVDATRPAHRAYLTSLIEKNQLFASGPFEDGSGAMIVYAADSPEAVEALMQARERIERDAHPAGNRTFAMYRELKARAEPLTVPRHVLDTGKLSLEECVKSVMASASFLGQE